MFQTREHTVVREPLILFKCGHSCVCASICEKMSMNACMCLCKNRWTTTKRASREEKKQILASPATLFFPVILIDAGYRAWLILVSLQRRDGRIYASYRAPSRDEALYATSSLAGGRRQGDALITNSVPSKKRSCKSGFGFSLRQSSVCFVLCSNNVGVCVRVVCVCFWGCVFV